MQLSLQGAVGAYLFHCVCFAVDDTCIAGDESGFQSMWLLIRCHACIGFFQVKTVNNSSVTSSFKKSGLRFKRIHISEQSECEMWHSNGLQVQQPLEEAGGGAKLSNFTFTMVKWFCIIHGEQRVHSFKMITNVLVSSFRFIRIPLSSGYGPMTVINILFFQFGHRLQTSDSDVWGRSPRWKG